MKIRVKDHLGNKGWLIDIASNGIGTVMGDDGSFAFGDLRYITHIEDPPQEPTESHREVPEGLMFALRDFLQETNHGLPLMDKDTALAVIAKLRLSLINLEIDLTKE